VMQQWTVQSWAARLGITERHLRRLMQEHLHIAPLQYLQTRRLLQAKQWLTDTPWPIGDVAACSGFGSVRRFNAVFAKHYRLTPSSMRKTFKIRGTPTDGGSQAQSAGLTVLLPYRPPLDASHLLGFLHQRALPGLEVVDLAPLRYARSLRVGQGANCCQGWMVARFVPDSAVVELQVSASLGSVLLEVQGLCRRLFDLDADPLAYEALLAPAFPNTEGMRLPGTVDGFELAVRAIVGQQITVAAARTLCARLVAAFGQAVADTTTLPVQGISHYFPDAARIAKLAPAALGALGMVRQRQAAIIGLARAVVQGDLQLEPGAPLELTLQGLQAIEGIGPWTAQYIAMRALRWPDAFPTGDVALHKALGLAHTPRAQALAQAASQAWRPWRSYATIRAWHSVATKARMRA
jgi:AraC family transcriptional regulator of adaptative response / DNA-3-methyladenine glycosylase II